MKVFSLLLAALTITLVTAQNAQATQASCDDLAYGKWRRCHGNEACELRAYEYGNACQMQRTGEILYSEEFLAQ